MKPTAQKRSTVSALMRALQLAVFFEPIKLALQFALTLWTGHLGYSYFRDEFYYIACGRHLAWGYVDHGPIVALQARLGEVLFGVRYPGVIRDRGCCRSVPDRCHRMGARREASCTGPGDVWPDCLSAVHRH